MKFCKCGHLFFIDIQSQTYSINMKFDNLGNEIMPNSICKFQLDSLVTKTVRANQIYRKISAPSFVNAVVVIYLPKVVKLFHKFRIWECWRWNNIARDLSFLMGSVINKTDQVTWFRYNFFPQKSWKWGRKLWCIWFCKKFSLELFKMRKCQFEWDLLLNNVAELISNGRCFICSKLKAALVFNELKRPK